jgi:hypothetical protein
LPLDPRFTGSNPAKDNGFLMVIKTTSYGGEVKPSVKCKILQCVKELHRYEKRHSIDKIQGHFLPSFLHFATRCPLVIVRELWWINQE